MDIEYKYSWRDGALVKTDSNGNILSSTDIEPVSRKETSQPILPRTSVADNQSNSDTMEDVRQQAPSVTGAILNGIDENPPGEPQSPEKPILNVDDLAKRDHQAVEYSKALLVEGDTLVYITYPGDSKCFDSTGFEISGGPHRVHSSRLLATGSKIFAKLLSPTNQYRMLRKKKLVGNLPTSIKYVLDLTPPDEGDEAVQLTSELSCSLGVRLWYTAAQRCGISHNLVGGEDEIMDPRNVTSYGVPIAGAMPNVPEIDTSSHGSISDQDVNDNPPSSSWESLESKRQKREIADAVRMSLEELSKSKAKTAGKIDILNVPDYCPIRHRAGIGRLLRVLEGKDPGLDSAPKVWTLFVLAKYFDCTAAVVDWLVSWIIADPNTQFIEILPEVSCKIAFGLNNQMICRAAFSILVSEEALSLASRETGRVQADRNGTNQFGRLREDIDEDLRTRIEYASKNFASRVCKTFEALAGEEMIWVMQLPEYQKLQNFNKFVLSHMDYADQAPKWLSAIDQLSCDIRTYIRSSILASLSSSLTLDQVSTANSHRRAEKYTNLGTHNPLNDAFSLLYDRLLDKERIFTRFFWQSLLYTEFPNWLHCVRPSDTESKTRAAFLSGVMPSVSTLIISQKHLNESILDGIHERSFNDGIMPSEIVRDFTQNYPPRTYDTHKSHVHGGATDTEARNNTKSWNPFPIFKSRSASQEALLANDDDWNTSMTVDNWELDSDKSTTDFQYASLTNERASNNKPLIPTEIQGMNTTALRDVSRGPGSGNSEDMDVVEYLAHYHLLNPQPDHQKAVTSEKGFPVTNSDIPIRPKAQVTFSPGPDPVTTLDEKERPIRQKFESSKSQAVKIPIWTPDEPSSSVKATDKNPSLRDAESYLSRILQEFQRKQPVWKSYPILRPVREAFPKPSVPSDDKIPPTSPLFNMSKLFIEAKHHIRDIATAMLDQREMGFDVVLTDTLLCLGPEEFKYLPLWAGGDDDGSGGVFDDNIPFPLAGPNGPGPSFHTGFSNPSAASSEFDAMSDRSAFNTSVAVEDGFSDHIDRRLVVADDDFHSETFSEDSEIYDGKGKGVDRGGFYSRAPASEAAFSMADTTPDSVLDIETPNDCSVEMDYEVEGSDADTTVGQADDEDENEVWDGGDTESFDFGDSDEEMVNV